MANKIVLKKSSVAAKVPLAGDLDVGEIAINLADQKLYSKNASGTVILVGSGAGGAGDVSGPASATDNALARFDGTTGKLIQNSAVTLDDNNNIINANSLGFDTTPGTLPTSVGTMSWDDGEGIPSVILKGGNTTLQVGTQEYARVFNDSGATLTIGQVVYIFGAQGNRVAVRLAKADVEATSFGTIGLVAESIASGAEGFVIVSGALYKLNTTGLTAGSTVYLSPTTAGAITTTKPQAPDQLVVLGWVERVDNNVGSIYVKVDNGYELEELHDVQVNSPASGNLLIYDASTSPIGVWKNANLTAGTGVSVTNGAGSITLANTGVTSLTGTANEIDVSASTGAITLSLPVTINANTTGSAATLTTGRTIAITGDLAYTSPSFNGSTNVTAAGTLATVNANVGSFTNASVTVNAKGLVTAASSGTAPVTSVTGTSPVASSGGTTPAISLSAGYGDTLNPYASKTANYFLAAPNGSAGAPAFRAIVAADVPTLNQNTTGTAANVTGIVAVANGGSGTATPSLVAGTNVTITGSWPNQTIAATGGSGSGTVTDVSVVSANGFAGTVATPTTTPAITLTTSITGVLKGDGTAISAATAGTDYVTPTGTETLTNKTLTDPFIIGTITEDVFAITDGASVDLNPANGSIQTWTLGANRTATATSFGAGESMTVMVDDGTAYALTWPTTTWVGGSAPILATTGFTVIELWKVGSTLYGAIVGYTT